ncbi:MAG: hypothetical protein F6J97_12760 [Leptolyngbya sp. SIO4C1]|nr:hypothetical protein [Leptolyngbya sp. SIO4C1]
MAPPSDSNNRSNGQLNGQSNQSNEQSARHILKVVANTLAIATALTILISFTIYFIIGAFAISLGNGLRSIAAAILPFAVVFYISFFTTLFRIKSRIPLFNLYFVFSIWAIILLGMASNLYGFALPIGELLFSATMAATIWRYGRHSFWTFASCCYGIVTGALIYVIFWGLPL